MMFHEWVFLPFFAVAYAVYLALGRSSLRTFWLLIVSYAFYGWWNPLYLVLIGYSTLLDYGMAAGMARGRRRRVWLSVSIVNNLALLGFFKYGKFVTANLNALLASLGSAYQLPAPGFLMPVGLSFFTFKSIAYLADLYRGTAERERNIIRHAVFVSFFPLLIAGPIERAANLLGQLRAGVRVRWNDVSDGASLFVVGLFKKLALADCLSVYVDRIYGAPADFQSGSLLLATFAFSWQIYFDFSGYTDMARGIARLLGFRIMLNFNRPYLATGLGDFWRRWHISLSSWFRDYLYIPLGGNRKGASRTYFNLFLTMVVSGFWHGAAWTFVIWGALHGLGSGLTRALERSEFYNRRVPRLLKQLGCFAFVSFAWIFFKARDLDTALQIVRRIFSSGFSDPRFPVLLLALILAVWLYQYVCESRMKRFLVLAPVRVGAMVLMLLYLVVVAGSGGQAFIYNQF
jgi:alginate O-acetyltransferase complex protein AlgI